MPAKIKTNTDRLAEKFSVMYETGKRATRLRDSEIADLIGLKSVTSLRERKNDPLKFKFGEILMLSIMFCWSQQDIAELFSIMNYGK